MESCIKFHSALPAALQKTDTNFITLIALAEKLGETSANDTITGIANGFLHLPARFQTQKYFSRMIESLPPFKPPDSLNISDYVPCTSFLDDRLCERDVDTMLDNVEELDVLYHFLSELPEKLRTRENAQSFILYPEHLQHIWSLFVDEWLPGRFKTQETFNALMSRTAEDLKKLNRVTPICNDDATSQAEFDLFIAHAWHAEAFACFWRFGTPGLYKEYCQVLLSNNVPKLISVLNSYKHLILPELPTLSDSKKRELIKNISPNTDNRKLALELTHHDNETLNSKIDYYVVRMAAYEILECFCENFPPPLRTETNLEQLIRQPQYAYSIMRCMCLLPARAVTPLRFNQLLDNVEHTLDMCKTMSLLCQFSAMVPFDRTEIFDALLTTHRTHLQDMYKLLNKLLWKLDYYLATPTQRHNFQTDFRVIMENIEAISNICNTIEQIPHYINYGEMMLVIQQKGLITAQQKEKWKISEQSYHNILANTQKNLSDENYLVTVRAFFKPSPIKTDAQERPLLPINNVPPIRTITQPLVK